MLIDYRNDGPHKEITNVNTGAAVRIEYLGSFDDTGPAWMLHLRRWNEVENREEWIELESFNDVASAVLLGLFRVGG